MASCAQAFRHGPVNEVLPLGGCERFREKVNVIMPDQAITTIMRDVVDVIGIVFVGRGMQARQQ